jgi:hypothetical protein
MSLPKLPSGGFKNKLIGRTLSRRVASGAVKFSCFEWLFPVFQAPCEEGTEIVAHDEEGLGVIGQDA